MTTVGGGRKWFVKNSSRDSVNKLKCEPKRKESQKKKKSSKGSESFGQAQFQRLPFLEALDTMFEEQKHRERQKNTMCLETSQMPGYVILLH